MEDGTQVQVTAEDKKLDSEDDVAEIVAQIDSANNLEILKLSGNSYGKDAAKAIGRALSKHKDLKKALWSDMFVSRLKTEIPDALNHLGDGLIASGAHLVELDVSDNAFGPTGVKGLTMLLNSSVCYSLKVLKINNTGLGIGGGKILSQALTDCYHEAANNGGKFCLEVFQAGRNRLENEGAIALAEMFELLDSLVEVSMPQNGIYHEGFTALVKAFSSNKGLQVINMSDNTLTELGSQAIAGVLPDLQDLRVLNLGECLVRSEGATLIAGALENGHALLEELILCYDELDTDSAMEIVMAMGNKQNLKRLDLNGNEFGSEGIERIRVSMEGKGYDEEVLGSLSDDEGDTDEEEEDDPTLTSEQLNESKDSVEYVISEKNHDSDDRLKLLHELGDEPSTQDLTHVFIEGCKSFSKTCTAEERVEFRNFIDQCCKPICESGDVPQLINEVLVQTGQIKSEDKSFRPVINVEGPLLGLVILCKQSYCPIDCKDILEAFLQRPNKLIDAIRHDLFTELYSNN